MQSRAQAPAVVEKAGEMKSIKLGESDRLSKKVREDNIETDKHKMNLYSRQIGEYGIEAMGKLIKMRVLIVGMRGLGVEIAKDLVLAGPGAVTVFDPEACTMNDLGLNFFLSEDDVTNRTKRGDASAVQLQKLNRLVEVKSATALTEDLVAAHTCLVITRMSQKEAERWNSFCRSKGVGFIKADVYGPSGYVFVDFGESFFVRDMNGEQPISRIISHVSNDKEAVVTLVSPPDGRRHNLEMSDHDGFVSFEEVEGMGPEINSNSYKIKHVYKTRTDPKTGKEIKQFDAYAFSINLDTTNCGKYAGGGRMTQVKHPIKFEFKSLKDSTAEPGELLFTDGAKFGRAEQLHAGLRAMWLFESQEGHLPASEVDVQKVKDLGRDLPNYDDSVCDMLARYSNAEFQPLSAFFGGVVAQEVVKMTGKYTPLRQWLHLDAFEVLSNGAPMDFIVDRNNRRGDLARIIGMANVAKLLRSKTFLVGCGALGCEFLKNFALLGVACGPDGLVTVTDNDRIEVSNLSRQFLFREENVGQPKSMAASAAAKAMNPELNVKALELLVAPQTEGTFNDEFWSQQNFITNALDNVKARLYVDSKCVFYEKPLLESGTLGTKCNVQVILPFRTQSYADGPKDQENGDAIPMCTLRNFPSEIEHCIEWGRAQFTDLFASSAQETVNFTRDPETWLGELRKKTLDSGMSKGKLASAIAKEGAPTKAVLELARLAVASDSENSFDRCIADAFLLFHKMFRDKLVSLITSYPEDSVDSQGRPFWSGTKRFPRAVDRFNPDDENHMGFLMSTANLFAVNRGLRSSDDPVPADHPWRSTAYFAQVVKSMQAPPLRVESVDMSGGGEEEEEKRRSLMTDAQKLAEEDERDAKVVKEFSDMMDELAEIAVKLQKGTSRTIESAEFEKDQDWNYHIDFVTAASNLRAWNYRLKQASRHQVKMIAGRIIPALATTTAAVCGLVMLEMLKLVQDKPLEAFKDSSNSLGINGYFFSEPLPPAKAKDEYDPIEMSQVVCYPSGFTKWDKIRVKCDESSATLATFVQAFAQATNGLALTSLAHPNSNLEGAKGKGLFVYERDAWQADMKAEYAKRMDQPLKTIFSDIYGEDILKGKTYIIVETGQEDAEGNTIRVPTVVWMM